ncbi:unnamed protein product [Orchesella dallaii]|uniref:Methyl farnesoate epoxidase n=1 Tax=Orchesella dallaii TaxID=48710 RepID=A0ABP1QK50_9HEXA
MALGFSEALLLLTTALFAILYLTRKKKDSRYPRGPTPLPFIGNVHQIGRTPLKSFQKWAQEYGPIYSIKMGSVDTIILNDHKLVKELLADNATAGRSENPVITAFSKGHGIINVDGPTWEEQRRFTIRKLRDIGLLKSTIESKILEEVKSLLNVFERNVGKPMSENRMFNGAVVNTLWAIVSGERHEWDAPVEPEILKKTDELITAVSRIALTGLIFAPVMRHIVPKWSGWTDWTNSILNLKKVVDVTVVSHTEKHDPNNPNDFIDHFLAQIKNEDDPSSSFYKENGAANLFAVVTDLFVAGSETSANTITWAMLQLSQNLEAQIKMQKELDRILGAPGDGSRLPSLSDRPSLPYIDAVISEVLRISPVLALGAPHKMLQDMEFKGYFFPKGANMWVNIYSIHHDASIWGEDVEKFRPERFLSEDGTQVIRHEALLPFGTGRRVCIGETLAKDTIFLFLASIFHKFIVEPYPSCVKADMEPVIGFLLRTKPFKVVVRNRGK